MIAFVIAALVVAYVASIVVYGYAALIVGALVGVALAFVVILALTGDGLLPQKSGADH